MGGLFLLYTRHNPGDVLNLLLDDNDIGLMCRVESRHTTNIISIVK